MVDSSLNKNKIIVLNQEREKDIEKSGGDKHAQFNEIMGWMRIKFYFFKLDLYATSHVNLVKVIR